MKIKTAIRGSAILTLLGSCGLLVASLAGVGREARSAVLRFRSDPLLISSTLHAMREYDVDVEIINESTEPARILGSLDYCGGSCFSGRGVPTTIPARGVGRVGLHIQARTPGPLAEGLTFYTDRPAQPTLVLNFRGMVQDEKSDELTSQTTRH